MLPKQENIMKLESSPYISVNGMCTTEAIGHIAHMPETDQLKRLGYAVLCGIQATNTTQLWEAENYRGDTWHPVGDAISSAFEPIEGEGKVERTVHLFSGSVSPDSVELLARVVFDRQNVSAGCQGIQFNRLPWEIDDYRPSFERLRKVLPISRLVLSVSASQIIFMDPDELADHASRYKETVSTMLLDESCGNGVPMVANRLRPYIAELYERDIPVAVAGGLSPENLDQLLPLIHEFPKLSIDAESGLRVWPNGLNDLKASRFSVDKTRAFLAECALVLQAS